MKYCIAYLLLGMLCLVAHAEDEYRSFTDAQGRSIRLRVTACDLSRDSVTVQKENRQRVTVKISGFSAEDQAYIKEWHMANELLSERNLKIVCDDTVVFSRKEDIKGTEYSGGTYDLTPTTVVVGYKKYEETACRVSMENKGSVPIENARIEYRLYYEQDRMRVLKGEMNAPVLGTRKKVELLTKSVEIIKCSGKTSVTSGEIIGFRMRVYVKLPSGKEAIREYQHPTSLSASKYSWDLQDESSQVSGM